MQQQRQQFGAASSSSGSATYNAGSTSVVNPSTAKGGTLTLALSSTPDSFDPGNTYYAWVLDFDNLFTMPLFTYKSCAGILRLAGRAGPGHRHGHGQR